MKKLLSAVFMLTLAGLQLNATPAVQEQFYIAVENGNANLVKQLIKKGANVNERDYLGHLPVFMTKDLKTVEVLLDNGADVNAKDYQQSLLHSAVHNAVQNGNTELVKLLLKRGADVNIKDEDTDLLSTAILYAGYLGKDLSIIKLLVKHGADVNAQDKYGFTPLHHATNKEIAEYLIANGANVYIKNNFGLTPLHYSTDKDLLMLFLSKVRNPDTIADVTPLQIQVERGNKDLVNFWLEQGADINALDVYGNPVLSYAQTKDMIDFLVSKGAKADNLISAIILNDEEAAEKFMKTNLYCFRSPNGYNALYYAAKTENLKIAKMLIKRGADVNNKSPKGKTPLFEAVLTGNLEMVKLLVKNGADVNAEYDGMNPLFFAIFGEKNKDNKILKYLISKGADVDTKNGNTTLLWLAAHDGMAETVKILLKNGASLTPPPNAASSPVQAALDANTDLQTKETMLKEMIKYGADMNMNLPYTPKIPLLYSTISNNQLDLLKLMIKLGAKVNSDTEIGKFYVSTAVNNNNKDMVTLLLDNNAPINAKDYSGNTALDYAQTEDMKQLLISRGAKSGKDLK